MDVPLSASTVLAARDELFSTDEQLALAGFLHQGYLFEWWPGSGPASLELRCLSGWLANGSSDWAAQLPLLRAEYPSPLWTFADAM